MAVTDGPRIITDRLILNLDAANPKSLLKTVEVLVVGGGGGGGTGGGGGGAGGLIYSLDYSVTPGSAITVTVGSGGAGTSVWGGNGANGGNSVFGTLTAIGGGAGGHRYSSPTQGTGGSGGGNAGGTSGSGTVTMANGTSGQGFTGGSSIVNGSTQEEPGGGGGGAGGRGADSIIPANTTNAAANSALPGAGGVGLQYSISGTLTYYAGGGGGSNRNGVGGAGGLGGGGAGGTSPVAGTNGLGGGGGGTGYSGYGGGGTSAVGGSGVVIVRYPGPQKATGGTITSSGNFTVHTFTTSGTFTPGTNWSDVSGFNYTGVLTNGPTYNSANNGYLSFDGVNDYVSLSSSVGAFGTGNFTINCWWKSSGTQSNYVAIMEQGFTGSPSNGAWAFKITHNTSIINFTYYNGGIVDNLSSVNINDGTWHNYVAVRSGTNLTLYVDGVSRYSLTLPISYSFGEGSPVFVGYNPRDGTYINGLLPILSVYTRALSVTEVQQNFDALRTRYGI